MKSRKKSKKFLAYLIPLILVAGTALGAGVWLLSVDVPIEYEEPYTISMSQNETSDNYEWEALRFRETTTTQTAYFNETGSGISYHQYVKIENPTEGANVNVKADIEEPTGFNDQMGFTILDGIVEPGEASETEVDSWGNISTGDVAIPAGDTVNFTAIYTLSNDAPSSNGYEVTWDFYEGESVTVSDGDSIQNAIDSVSGTVIFVETGTYNENLMIDKGITLHGIGNPTIDAANNDEYGVHITANEVTLQGFTVKSGKSGVVVDEASDCFIYDVIAEQNTNFGVMIQGIENPAEHNTVQDVIARNNDNQHGIAIEYDANNNKVINCTANDNGGNGFGINREAEDNIITGGKAFGNGLGGVGLFSGPWRADGADDPHGPQGNTVENVEIHDNVEYGISIKTSDAEYEGDGVNDGGDIQYNTIGPNNIYANPVGIEVIDGNENATITGLDITDNDITVQSADGTGIEVNDTKGTDELTVNINDNAFDISADSSNAEVYVDDVEGILDLDAILNDQGNTFDPNGEVDGNQIVPTS